GLDFGMCSQRPLDPRWRVQSERRRRKGPANPRTSDHPTVLRLPKDGRRTTTSQSQRGPLRSRRHAKRTIRSCESKTQHPALTGLFTSASVAGLLCLSLSSRNKVVHVVTSSNRLFRKTQ